MNKNMIIEEMDLMLETRGTGLSVAEGGDTRTVYVRGNRDKGSRVRDFVAEVVSRGVVPALQSEANRVGEWVEIERKVLVLNGQYYMVSRQYNQA